MGHYFLLGNLKLLDHFFVSAGLHGSNKRIFV